MGFTGDPHTAYGSDFEEIQVPTKLGWLRRWAFPPSWCRHAAHGHSSGGAGAQRPVGHDMADGLDFANADVTEDFAALPARSSSRTDAPTASFRSKRAPGADRLLANGHRPHPVLEGGPGTLRSRTSGLSAQPSVEWHRGNKKRRGRIDALSTDDSRQPAETWLAGRDRKALAEMEAGGRGTRAGEARRRPHMDQGAGGRRHRNRQRQRAVPHPFRARLPGVGRGHRLEPQDEDGHPKQPLRRGRAHRDGKAEAQPPRPPRRSRLLPRAYQP